MKISDDIIGYLEDDLSKHFNCLLVYKTHKIDCREYQELIGSHIKNILALKNSMKQFQVLDTENY